METDSPTDAIDRDITTASEAPAQLPRAVTDPPTRRPAPPRSQDRRATTGTGTDISAITPPAKQAAGFTDHHQPDLAHRSQPSIDPATPVPTAAVSSSADTATVLIQWPAAAQAVAPAPAPTATPTPTTPAGVSVVSELNTTVADLFDATAKWLAALPTNPVSDFFEGALLLIRRNLFNQAPTAAPVQLKTTLTGEIEGTLGVADTEGDAVRYTVVDAPDLGTVELGADGTYIYTPGPDFAGADTFTVAIADSGFNLLQPNRTPTTTTVSVAETELLKVNFGPLIGLVAEKGFDIQNLTASPLKFIGVEPATVGPGSCGYAGPCPPSSLVKIAPPLGFVFQPGEKVHIELANVGTQRVNLSFAPTEYGDLFLGTSDTFVAQLGLGVFSGDWECVKGDCDLSANRTVRFLDPPGTVYDIPGADAQQQADLLKQMCGGGSIRCEFTPKSVEETLSDWRTTSSVIDGSSSPPGLLRQLVDADMRTSASVKLAGDARTAVLKAVEIGIAKAGYPSSAFSPTGTGDIFYQLTADGRDPGQGAVFEVRDPITRVTGEMSILVGNSVVKLQDLSFDTPTYSRTGEFRLTPITQPGTTAAREASVVADQPQSWAELVTPTVTAAVAADESQTEIDPRVFGRGPTVEQFLDETEAFFRKNFPNSTWLPDSIQRERARWLNQTPTAAPVQLLTTLTGEIKGTLGVVDTEGDPLRYTLVGAPDLGEVRLAADGTYTYTPGPDFAGADTFTVAIADDGFNLLQPNRIPTTTTVSVAETELLKVDFGPLIGLVAEKEFDIQNLTASPLRFSGAVSSTQENPYVLFDGRLVKTAPPLGSVFQPGEKVTIELANVGTQRVNVYFQRTEGTAETFVAQLGLGLFSEDWECVKGNCDLSVKRTVRFLDPPGTVYDIPGADAQRQADLINSMCGGGSIRCEFTPKTVKESLSDWRTTSSVIDGTSSLPVIFRRLVDRDVLSSTNLKLAGDGRAAVLKAVELGIVKAGYPSWIFSPTGTSEVSYLQTVDGRDPGQSAVFEVRDPLTTVTGDVSILVGNAVFKLRDLSFVTADSTRVGEFRTREIPTITPLSI